MAEMRPKMTMLSDLIPNQEGIFFAALALKEFKTTREKKPYYRLTFQDNKRQATAMIWSDSPFYEECHTKWKPGGIYKIQALYKVDDFGPQLDLRRIRPVTERDYSEGLQKNDCRPHSSVDPAILYDEILGIARSTLAKNPLLELILRIFKDHRAAILEAPSSRDLHHAFFGGMLEHTLSVTRTALFFIDHYQKLYPVARGEKPLFSPPLVIAGAILHEIGKIFAMDLDQIKPTHTPAGELVGYVILGRDLVRQYALELNLDTEIRLQLEHIIVSHARFPEWGAPMVPKSMEATLVHLADYSDSVFAASVKCIEALNSEDSRSRVKGPFGSPFIR